MIFVLNGKRRSLFRKLFVLYSIEFVHCEEDL